MSETFHIPRVNVIESSEGFSVEVLGRTGLQYKEAGRSLEVDSEVLSGTAGIMVVANSIQRWASPNNESGGIDLAERRRIIENIQRAFAWRGHKIEVVPAGWQNA